MMRKLLVMIGLFINVCLSGQLLANTGDYFNLTEVGTSAEMVRIGNIEGFGRQANVLFENPGALYQVNKFSTSGFMTTFMEEAKYQNLSFAVRMPIGVLGLGYMGLGVDEIAKTKALIDNANFAPDPIGYFGYKSSMFKAAYQISQSESLHIGVSGTYYLTEFDTLKGSGYNFDLGVILDGDVLDASFVVKNVASRYAINYTDTDLGPQSSDGQKEQLPMQTFYGLKYKMNNFNVYGQFKSPGRGRRFLKSFGVEFNPHFFKFLKVSAGMKQSMLTRNIENNLEVDIIDQSKTMGVGLELNGVNFDYAYEQSEHFEFKSKHYFSLGFSF